MTIRRLHSLTALLCAISLAASAHAGAAVTIGQVAPSTPAATCPPSDTDYLQPSVTSGNLYSAKEAGTITSWSTRGAAGPGQEYTFKVFRRTTDPDVFRVIAHSAEVPLPASAGLHTFPTNLQVSSGDLIGFNAGGLTNACTFSILGDTVLERTGNLADGAQGTFSPLTDSRLNLSAVLAPTNAFSFGGVTRERSTGSATLTVVVPNAGLVRVSGKGLRAKDASKSAFVAGAVNFGIAAKGKRRKKLMRRGSVVLRLSVTFTPNGGDPSTQPINIKLKRKR